MAAAPFSWIKPEPHGIHIVPADCWVDPSRAVDRALVTHGHADHARGGHGQTVATPETLAIMELRYATRDGATPVAYGETIRLPGGVDATYIPAGHVLGSAQILLEHAGERVIVTGDYKRRHDPTCPPFEVTPCDIFITEATFGLPVFCHPPIEDEMAKLLDRLAAHPDSCVLVGAYALGKAQRVIAELRRAGHRDPIYLHGAMERCAGSMKNTGSTSASCDWLPIMPRTICADRSSSARRPPSTIAGRAACPNRSPPWPAAGCAFASARASATSDCR